MNSGCTYDELFSTVEQKSLEGTKVNVYSCMSDYAEQLFEAFQGKPKTDVDKQFVEEVNSLDPDCVVFNWECSSMYGDTPFVECHKQVEQLLKFAIRKGYMSMFSDFSLKSLILSWDIFDRDFFGPNPFVKIGETSQSFTMKFQSKVLQDCPSAQLQVIG